MHPKVREAYKEANIPIPPTPREAKEVAFKRKTKRMKEGEIKKFINQVWRVNQGPGKEFIFYEQKEVGEDLAGNEVPFTSTVGKYDMPKFKKTYDNNSGDVVATHVSGFETVYEIPWTPEKMEEILNSGNSDNTGFVLVSGTRRYGRFTADDFINKSFDQLMAGEDEEEGEQKEEPVKPTKKSFNARQWEKQLKREAEERAIKLEKQQPKEESKKGPDETEKIKEEVNFVIKKEDLEEEPEEEEE